MDRLADKVGLVTGGGSGIGRAAALAMAREGARVVVTGRRAAPLNETIALIVSERGEGLAVPTDVSRSAEVTALIEQVVARYGRLDVACNAAGTVAFAPLVEASEEDFDRTIATNLKGVWLCMRAEIGQMLGQGGGAIVNISSVNAVRPATESLDYSATKAAVVNLTQAAALAYAKQGVRVNAINSGAFPTEMLDEAMAYASGGSREEGLAQYERFLPIGRLGRLEEIAEAVVWLCSPAASYVTGHALAVDGGWAPA